MLDSKITNINSCIGYISKSEGMLNEFEKALSKKLGALQSDEDAQSEISFNEENNLQQFEGQQVEFVDEEMKDK